MGLSTMPLDLHNDLLCNEHCGKDLGRYMTKQRLLETDGLETSRI